MTVAPAPGSGATDATPNVVEEIAARRRADLGPELERITGPLDTRRIDILLDQGFEGRDEARGLSLLHQAADKGYAKAAARLAELQKA